MPRYGATGGIAITRHAGTTYVNADAAWLGQLGVDCVARERAAGRWVKLAPAQVTSVDGFALDDVAEQLQDVALAGARVIEDGETIRIEAKDGSALTVTARGTPYPLVATFPGADGGQMRFTDYDAEMRITAPAGALAGEDLERSSER